MQWSELLVNGIQLHLAQLVSPEKKAPPQTALTYAHVFISHTQASERKTKCSAHQHLLLHILL